MQHLQPHPSSAHRSLDFSAAPLIALLFIILITGGVAVTVAWTSLNLIAHGSANSEQIWSGALAAAYLVALVGVMWRYLGQLDPSRAVHE